MTSSLQENTEGFAGRIQSGIKGSCLVLALNIGHRLKLFDLLAEITSEDEPKTSQQIADASQMKERYIREWLSSMVAMHVLECDPEARLFYLPKHRAPVLTSNSPRCMLHMPNMIPMLGAVTQKLEGCFNSDGPRGLSYDDFDEFHQWMAAMSSHEHSVNLLDKFVPSIPGMREELNKGAKVLDVGCGRGYPSRLLAKEFPNSTFVGIDFSEQAIHFAKKETENLELKNVEYVLGCATKLPENWAGSFHLVTAFDAIHDQARPDLTLKEIYRVLKPGGYFAMVDVEGRSNALQDREVKNCEIKYMASLYHCMPVSLYFEGGMGVGAMWGEVLAKKMLEDAGFVNIEVRNHHSPVNVNYYCTKPE